MDVLVGQADASKVDQWCLRRILNIRWLSARAQSAQCEL